MTDRTPNWQKLCQTTALPDWDLEKGLPVSRDLWWIAKLFYDRVLAEESCWLLPFVSPSGEGSICFSWYYGYRKFTLEITDGLWECREKDDGVWRQPIEGILPDEAAEKIRIFYSKCLRDKYNDRRNKQRI